MSKKSLPLKLLINTNIDDGGELLSGDNFSRLCIIGKSENGRGSLFGVYKSIDEVMAHYGVEASEYKAALRFFEQNKNGELVIATADYDSIEREPIEEPEPEPEPEPGDDDDEFERDYIALKYEPYYEPVYETEPEPEEPEEPEEPGETDSGCRSTAVGFGVQNTKGLDNYELVQVYMSIRLQGVDYTLNTPPVDAYEFVKLVDEKGAGFVSNQLISAMLESLFARYPYHADYLASRSNYALTSFDYGKRLSGIDFANKNSLIEEIESIGGRADRFFYESSEVVFNTIPRSQLESKTRGDVKAVDLLGLFNKGRRFILRSCMAFNYTPAVPVIERECEANDLDFNVARIEHFDVAENVQFWCTVSISGKDYTFGTNALPADFITERIDELGAAYTSNQIMQTIVGRIIESNADAKKTVISHTTYALASFDYGRRIGGIDSRNYLDLQEGIEAVGGKASNFTDNPIRIEFKRVPDETLERLSDGSTKAVNALDVFNKGEDFTLKSCLSYKYELDEYIPGPEPTAGGNLKFTTTRNTPIDWLVDYDYGSLYDYADEFQYAADTVVVIRVKSDYEHYTPDFSLLENGRLVLGHDVTDNYNWIFDKTVIGNSALTNPHYGEVTDNGDGTYTLEYAFDISDRAGGDILGQPFEVARDVDGNVIHPVEVISPPHFADRSTTNTYDLIFDSAYEEDVYSIEVEIHLVTSTSYEIDPVREVEYDSGYFSVSYPSDSNTLEIHETGNNKLSLYTYDHNLIMPDHISDMIDDTSGMFSRCYSFDQDLSSWDMIRVKNMDNMFFNALFFNQDLSGWCVPNVTTKPVGWDRDNLPEMSESFYPVWGTCPDDDDD